MKTANKLVLVIVLALISIQVKAQDKIIEFRKLPKTAQDFVSTYYDLNDVSYVKLEKDFMSTSYEVILRNGIDLEFDSNGNWTEVDAKKNSVPNKLVLPIIQSYVQKSFPNNEIVQISRKGRKIEIELTNGLDLEFNKKGQFIRIDD